MSFPVAGSPFEITDLPTFKYQLSLEDSLNFIHNDNTAQHNFEYKLYNADNSNEYVEPVTPTFMHFTVIQPSLVAKTQVNATGSVDFGGITRIVTATADNGATFNGYTIYFKLAADPNAQLSATPRDDVNHKWIVTWGMNVPEPTLAQIDVLFGHVSFTADALHSADLLTNTITLNGGVNAQTAQVGIYSFELTRLLKVGEIVILNGKNYKCGVDFAGTTISAQVSSLGAAIVAGDVRFNSYTFSGTVLTIEEGTPSGLPLVEPTVE